MAGMGIIVGMGTGTSGYVCLHPHLHIQMKNKSDIFHTHTQLMREFFHKNRPRVQKILTKMSLFVFLGL